jgi:alcohol dehydrogenase class IV
MALQAIATTLPAMYDGDRAAAGPLLQGSYLAGLALSHARLGIVHGLAHPLGARWHAPHGLVCACCLPAALRFNATATAAARQRLTLLLGRDIEDLVAELMAHFELVSPFKGQPLRDCDGILRETIGSAGSTAANPRNVTAEDAMALLREIFAT